MTLRTDDCFRDDDWPGASRVAMGRADAPRYFDRARRADLAGRRTDALLLYACGLRLDPNDEASYRRMFETALLRFRDGKPTLDGPMEQALERFAGSSSVDRFVAAALAWTLRLEEPEPALKALEAAAAAGLERFGQWHAPHVFLALWQHGTRDRATWRRAEEACAAVQAWDWVVRVVDVIDALDE